MYRKDSYSHICSIKDCYNVGQIFIRGMSFCKNHNPLREDPVDIEWLKDD